MTITDEMKKAIDIIENTDEPIYITGKAGTGKTTLLRYIVQTVKKDFVVTAPTGVAAINAGGMTLHSLLNIPFGCLDDSTNLGGLPPNKKKLINKIDAIIIDEVSMVRPDLLDFIDRKLRAYRVCDRPFGGVQMIMIGDLYQLPPVIKSDEEKVIRRTYKGDFFFFAKVFKNIGFHIVELNHIFRQSDPKFISILNNIRSYKLPIGDMDELAELRDKVKSEDYDSQAIHICTHKRDVQSINTKLLGEATHTFTATITGKFSDKVAPCDMELKLREGARVMLLVNDRDGKYYNGSLGNVKEFVEDKITVVLDDGEEVFVEPHKWEAYEYKIKDDQVTKTSVGTCTQYPLTLAWAITIHKSQGLTFPKIVVHNKYTFCPGQIYVALSRCTSMEGITLDSYITKRHIMPDDDLIRFEEAVQQTGGDFNSETYRILSE